MKKVLSFVLVLAMILGSVSMAFADYVQFDADVAVWDDQAFADAKENGVATYLKMIGALEGYEDGTVKAENNLTRAEAVTMLVRALGLDSLGKVQVKTVFKDVPATHWASGYVAVANQKGFADGVGNNNFNPDAKITMDEAIAMMLKVLGYQDKYLQGTWPTNVEVAAYGIDLLNKVNGQALTVGAQNATRQDFFNLLFNALGKDLVAWNKNYEAFVPVDALGQVVGTLYAGGFGRTAVQLSKKMTGYAPLTISAINVSTENVKTQKIPAAYLGKNVTFLGTIVKGNTYIVSNAGVWSVNSKTVEGNFSKDCDETLATTFAGLTTTDKADDVVLLVNGGSVTDDDSEGETSDFYEKATSKAAVTAEVVYNADGTVAKFASFSVWAPDKIFMVDATEAAFLAAEDYAKLTAYGNKNFAKLATSQSAVGSKVYVLSAKQALTVEGAVSKLSDIEEKDIVELYFDGYTGKVSKVVVTRNVVTGLMTDYSMKNATFTVAGKEYKVAADRAATFTADLANYQTLEKALNVTSYSLYLNAAGQIAFAEYTTEKAIKVVPRLAFVLTRGAVDVHKQVAGYEGYYVTEDVKNAYIRLLPLDTMVEEDFDLVSQGATAFDGFFADDEWKSGVIPSGELVLFTAKDGKLDTLATKTNLEVANYTVTFSAVGFTAQDSTKNRLYAADAKAYLFPAGDEAWKTTKAAYYVEKAAADLAKATSTNVKYVQDAKGFVTKVILANYTPVVKSKTVTAAAIADLTGTKFAYVQAGSDVVETLTITSTSIKNDIAGLTKDVLYKVTYVNGVVDAKPTALTNKVTLTSNGAFNKNAALAGNKYRAAELTYVNGVLYDDATPIVRLLNGKFMVEGKDGYLTAVAEDDIDAKLAKAKYLDIYKAFQDDYYDTVVIRLD